MHRTRNAAYGQPYRGFESLPLRHLMCSAIVSDEYLRFIPLLALVLITRGAKITRPPRERLALFLAHFVGTSLAGVNRQKARRCRRALTAIEIFLRKSHRRRDPVAADPPGAALERSVRLFHPDDEDLRTRLDVTFVTRDVRYDWRIGGDGDLLFSVFVFQRQRSALDRADDLLDIGIGHCALRLQIPRVMALAGAAHRFRKDVHFDSGKAAVGLRHRRDADKRFCLMSD